MARPACTIASERTDYNASMVVRCMIAAVLAAAGCGSDASVTCAQAVDAELAIFEHQPTPAGWRPVSPDSKDAARRQAIRGCERRDWDQLQRRCVMAAQRAAGKRASGGPDAEAAQDLAAVARCHLEADQRRHPEWGLPP